MLGGVCISCDQRAGLYDNNYDRRFGLRQSSMGLSVPYLGVPLVSDERTFV
jgi:hypothetical protein